MSSVTIDGRFAGTANVVKAVKTLLDNGGEIPPELASVEQQARAFLASRDTCDVGYAAHDDDTVLEFSIEGGVHNGNELWDKCRAILAALESEEFSYAMFNDQAGFIHVSLGNVTERYEYTTGAGCKSDNLVFDAMLEKERFALFWQLARAGKLDNPSQPRVGAVCAQIFASLGKVDKDSDLYAAIYKMKDIYKIVAKVFPERASQFSWRLMREADKLLEYVQAHAAAIPEWELQDAKIETERLDDDEEDPIHNVSIRFRSFGEDFEWNFRHQPYLQDDEITVLINDLAANYLSGRIIPVKGGCVYVDANWHDRILRALAPPNRVRQIIDNDDYDAFYALHDTIGYWATALAFEIPGDDGISAQQYMDQHPEKPIAQAWESMN